MKCRTEQAANNEPLPKLNAGDFFQKAVSALAGKRQDYLSALEKLDDSGDYILRLLFADSAAVIQDCIEIISGTANEYDI